MKSALRLVPFSSRCSFVEVHNILTFFLESVVVLYVLPSEFMTLLSFSAHSTHDLRFPCRPRAECCVLLDSGCLQTVAGGKKVLVSNLSPLRLAIQTTSEAIHGRPNTSNISPCTVHRKSLYRKSPCFQSPPPPPPPDAPSLWRTRGQWSNN